VAEDQDLQPLLDTLQNQLSIIFSESNSIDTKALALIGTSVAILLFAEQASLSISHFWLGTLMIGSYIISVLLSIIALWNWPYVGAAIKMDSHPEYLDFDSDSLLLQLIADSEYAIDRNQQLNRRRWHLVLTSFALMASGTLALFVIL
jgi:hypothetical protein